jgi:hypothetical protein
MSMVGWLGRTAFTWAIWLRNPLLPSPVAVLPAPPPPTHTHVFNTQTHIYLWCMLLRAVLDALVEAKEQQQAAHLPFLCASIPPSHLP